MRLSTPLAWATLAFSLCACSLPPVGPAKAQETARDHNLNTRFGRLALAAEDVAPEERAAFASRHRGWGRWVRVVDEEAVGMQMPSKTEAVIHVNIAWFAPNDGDLHVTTVRQRWEERKTSWVLVGETAIDGDKRLFGEAPSVAPSQPKQRQFPTRHIGGSQSGPFARGDR